jgi:prevent-host-death family protein
MKTVSVRDLQKTVKKCVDAAQDERIVVTRNGKPAALLVGLEGQDWEAVLLQTSPTFWKLIEKRRKETTVSLSEMRKLLETPLKRRR